MPSHHASSVAASPLLLLLPVCPKVLSAHAESYCRSGTHGTNGSSPYSPLAVAASNAHLLNAPILPEALTSFSDYCDMWEVMDGLSKLTDMLLRMADSIVKLPSFTEQQGTFNSLVSSKLECLIKLTECVKYLETKTALLKSCLSKEVDAPKSNCDVGQSTHENELIISGIPDTINDSPQHIIGSVLSALHTSYVSSEISEIHVLNCKLPLTSDSMLCSNKVHSTTSNRTASTSISPSPKTNGTKAVISSCYFKSVLARNQGLIRNV